METKPVRTTLGLLSTPMIAPMVRVLLLVVGVTLTVDAFSGQTFFQEAGGILVMEVESAPPAGDWKAETELKGFKGECYYTWRGQNYFKNPSQKGVLTYTFVITTPGKYHLRIHNRHDFHDSTESNDCYTRMDGGKWVKTFSSKRGEWTFHSNHEFSHSSKLPANYELSAGVHTLELAGRSKDFSIDRIHLFLDGKKGDDASLPQSRPATLPANQIPVNSKK